MPETIDRETFARSEDACVAAAIDLRYAADQFERTARYLRERRFAQAEDSFQRAVDGYQRAGAAFDGVD